MKISNEAALRSHMARALENYANQVQNGSVKPWLPLLDGAESVVVKVTVLEGGLIVEPVFAVVKPKEEQINPTEVTVNPPQNEVTLETIIEQPEEKKPKRRK